MGDFNLSKTVVKIGDSVDIQGLCVGSWSTFSSDNPSIAVVSGATGTGVQAVGIGTSNISETSLYCSNTGAIQLSVTEDWKPFFMSRDEFLQFNEYEVVFIFGLLFIAFLIRFAKRT